MLTLEQESTRDLFAGRKHVLKYEVAPGKGSPERLIETADARKARLNSCVAI
jgi:hypothetical protein